MFYFVFVVVGASRLGPFFLKDYNHWNPKEIELHSGNGKVSLSKINLEVGSLGFRDDEMVFEHSSGQFIATNPPRSPQIGSLVRESYPKSSLFRFRNYSNSPRVDEFYTLEAVSASQWQISVSQRELELGVPEAPWKSLHSGKLT